ncbi:MXAN_6640 family putative metalloprotease [Nocardioides sp. GXQ0305]|uniref:MXAN_6640 family putative metalloprotease n=1 Tax=Nocardioides sp. GXQ0305 TaxID=3423912 RepID=UPI003D7D3633
MRPRLLTALAAGALTLSLLGPTGAQADDPDVSAPTPPDTTTAEEATEVLEEAEELFEERPPAEAQELLADGGLDATMVLNELLRARPDLSAQQRRRADALLARPTDGASDPFGDGYRRREAKPVCGGAICVHYVRRTADAPPRRDSDGDGIRDAVEQTLQITRAVHSTFVNSGYRRPDSDGRRGGRRGKVDVYLANIDEDGYYGYCASDQRQAPSGTSNRWAYCVVDDDYARFATPEITALENRKVTLAHEYFHAVQYAYDAFEDGWFMEATAAWVEDEIYDSVDDNRQYLLAGQLGSPRVALDRFDTFGGDGYGHYGNWIWFRYLTERWPQELGTLPRFVLEAWRGASGRRGAANLYSTQAINAALNDRETNFTEAFGDFAAVNRDPALNYEEGGAYEADPPFPIPAARIRTHPISATSEPVGDAVTVDHLASGTVGFVPVELAEPGWTLTVSATLPPATAQSVRLLVHQADGTVTTAELQPTGEEVSATVPFSTDDVSDVELVVVNANRQMTCWKNRPYACSGIPRGDDLVTNYSTSLQPPV